MTIQQQRITDFMVKAGQATPSKPVVPDAKTRILRVRLLLEEVLELAESSGVSVSSLDGRQIKSMKDVTVSDNGQEVSLVGVADALADIDYVNIGAAVSYGIDLGPCQDEVHASNMSKFIDGHKDAVTGKWIKGPSYKPADLKSVIEKQNDGDICKTSN